MKNIIALCPNNTSALSILIMLLFSFSFHAQDASTLVFKLDGKESAYPRLSRDNEKILYQSNATGLWQLYILNRTSGKQTLVSPSNHNDNFPDWSYDNEWIAFTSDRDGNEEIYLMRNDGSELRRLTDHPERDIHPYFSPDGNIFCLVPPAAMVHLISIVIQSLPAH
jgi:dipeptidyl aminopeptidase/acylaminoacyl peptidase